MAKSTRVAAHGGARQRVGSARGGATVASVCRALERMAPLAQAQPWDNVGLLAGHRRRAVRRIMLCIDLMPAVVREAIRRHADLVVAYHPPVFRPLSRLVTPTDGMEAGVLRCLERGIAIYSPHTALDAAGGGTNATLAALSGVAEPAAIAPADGPGPPVGLRGRLGASTTLGRLATRLAHQGRCRCVSLVGPRSLRVKAALVGVGAAGKELMAAGPRHGEVLITGELRHHDALSLLRLGAGAIVLSHWSSERPALAGLAKRLAAALDGPAVWLSKADAEPFSRL